LALACLCAHAGIGTGGVYEDAKGNFRIVVPPGWKIEAREGFSYKSLYLESDRGFNPNVNIEDEYFFGDLPAFLGKAKADIKRQFPACAILSESEYRDASKSGYKLVSRNPQPDAVYLHVQYLFQNGDRKYVITCTAREDLRAVYEARFEELVRGFAFLAPARSLL
jgi:hypothetical protein